MNKVLILFAHPRFEQSRTNSQLVAAIPKNEHITFHDLYEHYPNFHIDIEREKALLEAHDIIIWHHPLYWYSAPPLIKQWIDMVLEFGWAYGPGGKALEGKIIFNVITSGGTREVYNREGRNRFTIREFLAPFEQTVRLCHMDYLPPFAVQGTHLLAPEQLKAATQNYAQLLLRLVETKPKIKALQKLEYLNDWFEKDAVSA